MKILQVTRRISGTPQLTRLLPPNAMRRPPKENSTPQASCVRLTTLFFRAPKADCPTRAPSAYFFSKQTFGGLIPAWTVLILYYFIFFCLGHRFPIDDDSLLQKHEFIPTVNCLTFVVKFLKIYFT